MMARPLCALMALSLGLLAGCASLGQPRHERTEWQPHREQLQQLQNWTASGKVALRSPDASESLSITWQQRDAVTELQLSGPLGTGATILRSDGQTLTILNGQEQRTLDIATPGAIAAHTGWDLPLTALPFWLKGIPAPDLPLEQLVLDINNRPSQFAQGDWDIQVQRYKRFGDYTLPTKLFIQRGKTSARMILRHWVTEAD